MFSRNFQASIFFFLFWIFRYSFYLNTKLSAKTRLFWLLGWPDPGMRLVNRYPIDLDIWRHLRGRPIETGRSMCLSLSYVVTMTTRTLIFLDKMALPTPILLAALSLLVSWALGIWLVIFSAMVSEFGSPPKQPPKKVRVACQGFGLRAWQLMVGCGESEYR